MTDAVIRTALVTNESGFELRVEKAEGGQVYGELRVPESSSDELAPETAPVFRIDKHPAREIPADVEAMEVMLGMELTTLAPKRVRFLLWNGESSRPQGGPLEELMSGESVLFRYFLANGGYKETSFPLAGASDAMSVALHISDKPGTPVVGSETISTPDPKDIREADEQMVETCTFLGSVVGKSGWGGVAAGLARKGAMRSARKRAADLGATHMVVSGFDVGSGVTMRASTVNARAYRCSNGRP